jgi:dihydroorotate dehydrogenase (fumarate)
MERKGFTTVDALRGMLSVAPGAEADRERAGYVSAMRQANRSAYGPW